MLIQKHREYEIDAKDGCFAVGKTRDEIFQDLRNFCKRHPDKHIYYFEHPIRPSKTTLRPEYMMEIIMKDEYDIIANLLYRQAHNPD